MCAHDEERIKELESENEFLLEENERLRAENARGCSLEEMAAKIAEKVWTHPCAQNPMTTITQPQTFTPYYPNWTTTSSSMMARSNGSTTSDDTVLASAINSYYLNEDANKASLTATGQTMLQRSEREIRWRRLLEANGLDPSLAGLGRASDAEEGA